MTAADIERLLDAGYRVGYVKSTDDDRYLGWILVRKLKPNQRILEIMTEEEAPEIVREERRREAQPYQIQRIELKRSVHEAGEYETEADYRQKECYWFATLEGAAEQLLKWGYSLEDAKEGRELDAP